MLAKPVDTQEVYRQVVPDEVEDQQDPEEDQEEESEFLEEESDLDEDEDEDQEVPQSYGIARSSSSSKMRSLFRFVYLK